MTAVPVAFVPWRHPSPLLDAIGGFLQHPTDPLRVGFRVEGSKLNARGRLHGGVFGTIGDVVIGHALAGRTDPPTRLVTVNLTVEILASAGEGDWVEVDVTPKRLGRRLAAGSATFRTESVIATVHALFVPGEPVSSRGG